MSRRRSPLGHLLAAASILLAGSVMALPSAGHPNGRRQVQNAAPSPWVTVDASGDAMTIIPTVTTINGAATTISPPPESLTKTGTYTLAPTSAPVTTSTGLPPVATASSSNGDGAFLECTAYQGVNAPFCQPKSGSQLNPGKTYYVTWAPAWFYNTSAWVQIQGTYHDDSMEGFTSHQLLAGQGFYVWNIDSNFLESRTQPLSSLNVSLTLAYFEDDYGNDVVEIPGPTVIVTSTPFEDGSESSDNKPSVVSIAVPVVVIIVFLALAALCIWSWRRHGVVPVLGALRARPTATGGQGYGIRQSRSQRVGPGAGTDPAAAGSDKQAGVGIQLTDRDSWSPATSPSGPGGGPRNVFREELERQERER